MKYLTKEFMEQVNLIRLLNGVKASVVLDNASASTYAEIFEKEKKAFIKGAKNDAKIFGFKFDEKYEEELFSHTVFNKDELIKKLPKEVKEKFYDVRFLSLGYCKIEEKEIINAYIKESIKEIESLSAKARDNSEKALSELKSDLDIELYVDGILKDVYKKDGDYYFEFYDRNTLVIINGEFTERESKVINAWNIDDIYSSWTKVVAVELIKDDEGYGFNLLIEDRDLYERVHYYNYSLRCTGLKKE